MRIGFTMKGVFIMNKKTISFLLCLLLLLQLPTSLKAAEAQPAATFSDVEESSWYYDAVQYVVENNIMIGTDDDAFSPGTSLNRAMMVQMLYNLEGSPETGTANFTDVAAGAWYGDAVSWASENNVVSGTGNNMFSPNQEITREEMAVMMRNYCTSKEIELPATREPVDFADEPNMSSWAKDAIDVMYQAAVLSGVESGLFAPKYTATRAEVAQMFMNFMEAIEVE